MGENSKVVGQEVVAAMLPSNDGLTTTTMIDELHALHQWVATPEEKADYVKQLHGETTGSSSELVSLVKDLFGGSSEFTALISEMTELADELVDIAANIDGIMDPNKTPTLGEMSAGLKRAYASTIRKVLPPDVNSAILDELSFLPALVNIPDTLGDTLYNLNIPNRAIELVDGVMQDVMDSTGLSTMLNKQSMVRIIPEYMIGLHEEAKKFEYFMMRMMPRCAYGKMYQITDEALAHMFDFANDVLGFMHILDNRKTYMASLVRHYGELLLLNNVIYPLRHEYSFDIGIRTIHVNGADVAVDILGRVLHSPSNNTAVNVGSYPPPLE